MAVATLQYEVLPYLEGAEFAQLAALNVAIEGAAAGAINTGTLRGALIGSVTAEAFWGVGNVIQSSSGLGIPNNANFSSLNSGQVIGAVGLHAAVGCVSSVASGGRCGSGALSAGLGELVTGYTQDANPFVQGAVTALAGGTGAALTGGRFGDGFFIAASGYLFNQAAHTATSGTCSCSGGDPEEMDSRTFYHGTDPASANALVAGSPLTITAAQANNIGGPVGFYLATDYDAAYYFGSLHGGLAILQYTMSTPTLNTLLGAGSVLSPIPQGAARFAIPGSQLYVPPSAFPVFNDLRSSDRIGVVGIPIR